MPADGGECGPASETRATQADEHQLLVELSELLRRRTDLPVEVQLLAAAIGASKRSGSATDRMSFERGTTGENHAACEREAPELDTRQLPGHGCHGSVDQQDTVGERGCANASLAPSLKPQADTVPGEVSLSSPCIQSIKPSSPPQPGLEFHSEVGTVSGHSTDGIGSNGSARSEASGSDSSPRLSCERPSAPAHEPSLERADLAATHIEAGTECEEKDGAPERTYNVYRSLESRQAAAMAEKEIGGRLLTAAKAPAKGRPESNRKSGADTTDYHAMHRALPKVTGVRFQAQRNRFVAEWYEQGRTRMAYFPVKLYGFERARHLAIRCREEVLQLKNAKRGVYGEGSHSPNNHRKNGAAEAGSLVGESPVLKRRRLVGPSSPSSEASPLASPLLQRRSRSFAASPSTATTARSFFSLGRKAFSLSDEDISARLPWTKNEEQEPKTRKAGRSSRVPTTPADSQAEDDYMEREDAHADDESEHAKCTEHSDLHDLLRLSKLAAMGDADRSTKSAVTSCLSIDLPLTRQVASTPTCESSYSPMNAGNQARLHSSFDSALKSGLAQDARPRLAEEEAQVSRTPLSAEASFPCPQGQQRVVRSASDRSQRAAGPPMASATEGSRSGSNGLNIDPNLLLALLLGTGGSREQQAVLDHALESVTRLLGKSLARVCSRDTRRVSRTHEACPDEGPAPSLVRADCPRIASRGADEAEGSRTQESGRRQPCPESSYQGRSTSDSSFRPANDEKDEKLLLTKTAVRVILSDLLDRCIPRLAAVGKGEVDDTPVQLRRGFFTSVVMQAWRAVQDARTIDELYPLLAVCRPAIMSGELPSSWEVEKQHKFFVQLVGRRVTEGRPSRGEAAAPMASGETSESANHPAFSAHGLSTMPRDRARDHHEVKQKAWTPFRASDALDAPLESGSRDLTAF
ncbi:AP2 domain transcription factor AP2VIIa-1 [Besnoitia besnoiti]|uniref:AP2 domain transcription factor AP2VIIa-1 n=1 Tax=Besnoitia besnoiti TaxID=94643 RepID=A0A2A9MKU0_BESBE|nr:AP2 domain transcription factor AP2VIIa-1 [Besnoitia besnoiti]PFH36050.1 AP2 domain transcription factor AP2VIIa-1 [Besnoitia besnoiti]